MKDEIMRKFMRNTVKRVQTLFVRRKTGDTGDVNSGSQALQNDYGSTQIENGSEAYEVSYNTEPSSEPFDVSTDEESGSYLKEENRQSRTPVQQKLNKLLGITNSKRSNNEDSGAQIVSDGNHSESGTIDSESSDDEGACGPVPVICDASKSALVPVINDGQIVNKNVYPSYVNRSCGNLEKECLKYPLDLQEKILHIKETLLWRYPPYYDFCVIASDDDNEEAIRFKNYVAKSFDLAGCTLEDGFMTLGREIFDCYESMMDHSSKVFFFITENFTSSAFCKRLQSGAVFLSLMSKAKKDKEKCVPIFPYGYPSGCRLPLSLIGISGINPSQREATRRSLINTYSPQLRQHRYVLDLENFTKRCLEFEAHVIKCIEDYKRNHIQNKHSVMSVAENVGFVDQASWHPLEDQTPIIQLPENDDPAILNSRIHSIECSSERAVTIEKENSEKETLHRNYSPILHQKFNQNPENDELGSKDHSGFMNGNDKCDNGDDLWRNLPVPDEIREIVNNNVSSVSITDSATVHVGHVINVTINPSSPTFLSRLKQNINSKTTNFCEKEISEQLSDNSDG